VVVAVALLAGVRLGDDGRAPRQVVVEVLAALAVEPHRVVRALAAAVHHVGAVGDAGQRQTARRMAIAGAGSSHHHLVYAVVVLLLDLWASVQQLVS